MNPVKLIEPTYQSSPVEVKWHAVVIAGVSLAFALAQYLEWDMTIVAIVAAYVGPLVKSLLGLTLPSPPAATDPMPTPPWDLFAGSPAEPLSEDDEVLLERFREAMHRSDPMLPPEPKLPVVDHENLTSRPGGL